MKIFNSEKSKLKKFSALLAVLAFILTFQFSYINVKAVDSVSAQTVATETSDEKILSEARSLLERYYYKPVSEDILNSSTIEEMVKKLNDPYSSYFTKEEYNNFVNSIDNKFCGIGIQVDVISEGIKITRVMETSPAEEVGLKINDIITKVGDVNLAGLSAEEATKYIRGEEGTSIHIAVKRDTKVLNFDVVRRQITLPTVKSDVLNNNIGYIELSSFGDNSANEFYKNLKALKAKNVGSYIIDLRNDGGGYINAALAIGGNFVGDTPLVLMRDKDNNETVLNGFDYGSTIDKPIIFLINEYSASASELLSAAIKDYGKAYFVGTTSYGKGVAQNMFSLSNGAMLKITTSEFFSPHGNTINHIGITPDFPVKDDKVDSLAVARLLFSCTGKEDKIEALSNKTGYTKVKTNDKTFYIDLNESRKDENWEAYDYILNNVKSENIYVGSENGWIKYSQEDVNKKIALYYPGNKNLKDITKKKYDKNITITFNNSLNKETVNDKTIEIINSKTGERIPASLNTDNKNKVVLSLKNELKEGETYYILINKEIKSEKGNGLSKEIASKIYVEN